MTDTSNNIPAEVRCLSADIKAALVVTRMILHKEVNVPANLGFTTELALALTLYNMGYRQVNQ